ncbi:MAG: MFS transporter [Gammaproteobacteria bacterium]
MPPERVRHTAIAVVALCFTMNLVARGVGETYAVFLLPLGDEFAWSRGQLTSVYSIYMAVLGLSAPVGGWVFDRFGPRASYGLGIGCLALGFMGASKASALWHFYVCIGVVGGFGATSMGLVTSSALVSRWFRSRLGTAMGITYAGLNSGVVVLAPLTQFAIDSVGWRQTYSWLSLGLAVLIVPVLALPWRRIAKGHPDFAITARGGTTVGGGTRHRDQDDWTLAQAVRQRAFWGLFAVFFFTAVAVYAVSLQIVAYLVESGFSPLQAATAFGLAGTLSVGGMASAGWMSDRIGRRATVAITFSLTIMGIVLLYLTGRQPSLALLGAFVLCFGFSQGSRGPVISALCAELYKGTGLGAILGAISVGMGLGASIGSWVSGVLHDITGGYTAGFALAIAAALLGLSQFWLVRSLGPGAAARR